MVLRFGLILIIAVTVIPMLSRPVFAATLLTADKAARVVTLRDVTVKDGEVAGEIVNQSKQALREVQLQILYSWRWKDEWHPGTDDPGRAVYSMVDKEIAPGQSARFNFKPAPPLPARKDGFFDVSVKVVGYAQVYR
ncbi:MAG: hypothetical protein OEN50_16380 [Deltaproteobacteria bacterium]|nr:hypothetical protein [Deltaproteobacteria bacterium]